MGVETTLFVGSHDKISPVAFQSIAYELVHQQLVELPYGILQGRLSPIPFMLPLSGLHERPGTTRKGVTVYARGDDATSLQVHLKSARLETVPACIVFKGFDWSNAALQESFLRQGFYNVDVYLYSFPSARKIKTWNAYDYADDNWKPHTIQLAQYLCANGKSGPTSFIDTPLYALCEGYFGPDLFFACSWS